MIHSSGHESILSSLIESRDSCSQTLSRNCPPIVTLITSSQLFIRNEEHALDNYTICKNLQEESTENRKEESKI